jgi:hypothetical protein
MHLPLRFLRTHLGTRLGALGLLRGGRLSLHLPLGVLRRGGNLSAGAVHGACRRMLLAVIADAHGLVGTLRCRSGPCILQVCGAAGGVTWASQCGSGAQDIRSTVSCQPWLSAWRCHFLSTHVETRAYATLPCKNTLNRSYWRRFLHVGPQQEKSPAADGRAEVGSLPIRQKDRAGG